MAHHIGRARLTSASLPNGLGKTPPGSRALPVGCHPGTIIWTELGRRLRRFCSVLGVTTWNMHPSPFMGINAYIAHPCPNLGWTRLQGTLHSAGKMSVYRALAFFLQIIRTSEPPWPEGRLLSLPTRPFLEKPREGRRQVASPRGGPSLTYPHPQARIIRF